MTTLQIFISIAKGILVVGGLVGVYFLIRSLINDIGGNMNKSTIKALRKSITHHEDNLKKLKTGVGDFAEGHHCFYIGDTEISFKGEDCALCRKFKACPKCPLEINGYGCESFVKSAWFELSYCATKKEAIKAEKHMIKVLKKVLRKDKLWEEGITDSTDF